jgi:hypothetical protein
MTASAPIHPRNRAQHAGARDIGAAGTTCHDRTHTALAWQPVLTVRARIGKREESRFVADGLREIHAFMHEHDHQPAGLPFFITTSTARAETVDVEAGWPTDHAVAGADRIHSGMLPKTLLSNSTFPRHPSNRGRDPADLP